jgi:hypothetical protein
MVAFPQVMSLTMEFGDGTSGRHLMVQTDSLDEAKAVAKECLLCRARHNRHTCATSSPVPSRKRIMGYRPTRVKPSDC